MSMRHSTVGRAVTTTAAESPMSAAGVSDGMAAGFTRRASIGASPRAGSDRGTGKLRAPASTASPSGALTGRTIRDTDAQVPRTPDVAHFGTFGVSIPPSDTFVGPTPDRREWGRLLLGQTRLHPGGRPPGSRSVGAARASRTTSPCRRWVPRWSAWVPRPNGAAPRRPCRRPSQAHPDRTPLQRSTSLGRRGSTLLERRGDQRAVHPRL